MGENAHQFVKQQFSSQEVTKKLLDFFKQQLAAA